MSTDSGSNSEAFEARLVLMSTDLRAKAPQPAENCSDNLLLKRVKMGGSMTGKETRSKGSDVGDYMPRDDTTGKHL